MFLKLIMSGISSRFLCQEKTLAANSKTYLSRVTPIGSNEAVAGQTIRLRLPSMRPGAYVDCSQSYLSYDLTSTAAAALGPSGIGGLYRTIIVRCASQHLSSLENQQLWRNMKIMDNVKSDFLEKDGGIMMLTNTRDTGRSLVPNETYSVVDFMSLLSPLFEQECMLPLFTNSPIEIDILLGETTYNLQYDTLTNANAHATVADGLKLTNIALNLSICEMESQVDREILSFHGGVFKFISQNVHYAPFTIASGSASAVLNLPLSVSSLNKVDVVFTAQTTAETLPYSNFIKSGLVKAELLVDGVQVYPHGITARSNAEALVHARRSKHMLDDFENWGNATYTSYDTEGFILSFDTEKVHKSNMRAGLNVASSTCQLTLTFASPLGSAIDCHVYSTHDALSYVHLNGTKDFEMNI